MNHIVKVFRMKDQKVRIYELPADIEPIPAGTSLKVNFRGAQEAYGETMTESRYVTDDELFLVKEMLGIKGNLARVRSILTEAPVNWNHVDSHLAQTTDSTGEDADSSTDEAQDAEETEKEVGLDDWA